MNDRPQARSAKRPNSLPHFPSVTAFLQAEQPVFPVYCLYPARFRAMAGEFLGRFPGTTMYAVKANPAPQVLDQIWQAGIRHFDTASIGEIRQIRTRYAQSVCHFMAPVRIPGTAREAAREFGVRDFVIDSDAELDKLLSETEGMPDLRIFVRVATPLGGAVLELSSKFGTTPEDAARLLKRVKASGAQCALTFHVGSQCLSPFSYAQAVEMVRRAAVASGVKIMALDIGGGFPNPYPGNEVPPSHWYFDTIKEAISTFPLEKDGELLCEPGRALCAQGLSLVTRVILRKDDKLYLNDGIYGSFDELTLPGWTAEYAHRVLMTGPDGRVRERGGATQPFKAFGPTCDTLDVLPKPLLLPKTIQENDYILFENAGAYSAAVRTQFNGFYPDDWVVIGGE
ncbi:MAG: type III PLP-dependent enzyme [Alphaproteobacteria bacterium]